MLTPLKSLFILMITLLKISLTKTSQYIEHCVNTRGQAVDWYVIFLFPENSSPSNKLSYGYFDSRSKIMEYYLYDKETFPPLFFAKDLDKKVKTNYIFWNDDRSTENHREDAPSSKAHSKGSLIYNALSGKFLMHSLPRFPRRSDDNKIIEELPDNAGIYGQHFLCLSLQGKEAGDMIEKLDVIGPSIVYQHGEKDQVGYKTEFVEKFLTGKTDRSRPDGIDGTIKTKEGFGFDIFAKSSKIDDLPFEKMIPELYQSNIFVETWNKPELIPIICNRRYQVMNVKHLKFSDFSYFTSKEHSKWAVLENKPVSCFSDLNRIESQRKRGGMTLCIRKENLANVIRNGIIEYEKCGAKGFLENFEDIKTNSTNLKFLE